VKASLKTGRKARVERSQQEVSSFPLDALRAQYSFRGRRWKPDDQI